MNSELIECPACKHALRVPENLFGKTVRCPECKAHFTAPTRDADGKFGVPVLLPQPTAQRTAAGKSWDSPLFVPAMLLILVSFIGTLVNGYQTVTLFTDPDRAERAIGWLAEQLGNAMQQEKSKEQLDMALRAAPIAYSIIFAFNAISLLGGFAMMFRRFRWLSILGSVLAMINIGNCCCLIGLPAGGYCLVKLIDPDVKPLYKRQ